MAIMISPGDLASAPGVERRPLGQPGASGSVLERLLFPDGTSVVRKAFSADGDWMMRATHDPGRAATLWTSGAMDALPSVIDPAILRIERDPGHAVGWVLYLRDVSEHFLRRGSRVDATECRRTLDAMASMHEAFWSDDPTTRPHPGLVDLASLSDLVRLASPGTVQVEASSDHPFIAILRTGWEAFDELAPHDIRAAIHRVLEEPEPLAASLIASGATLIHADPHYGNIAPSADRFYILDWGLAAWGVPALDFAWWLDQSSSFLGASREELVDAFAAAEGPRHRRATLELALLAELVLAGWQYEAALRAPTAEARARRRADFDWWVAAARPGLEHLDFATGQRSASRDIRAR
jgi:hypothetical protein